MTTYISYLRCSTREQQLSGLGIIFQRNSINDFCNRTGGIIMEEFVEVVSGGEDDRQVLIAALERCREYKAILLVAKIDRLTRKLKHITLLRESKVRFVCADNPNASDFEINLRVCFAEEELRKIAERTKNALAVKKAELALKGIKLGNPKYFSNEGREKGIQRIKEKSMNNENNLRAKGYIQLLRSQGLTYKQIADLLNANGFKTSKGKSFRPHQVSRLLHI
jgi:DNA invertase Pin-like site-specific DNA recombinase